MIRLALTLLLIAGCAGKKAPSGARELTDGTGHKVRVGAVRRVVSLAPSSTEILFAIGAGSLLVGTDRYSDWPPAAQKIERVGADIDPSLERIVALRPDLVFTATSANNEATAEALERLGLPVFVSRVSTLDDIYGDIAGIGGAVGHSDNAARLVTSMKQRFSSVMSRVRAEAPVRTAVVVWSEPLVVAGGKSHVAELVRAAGGINIADDSPQPFPTYSLERLVERAPQVLIIGSHSDVTPPTAALEALTTVPTVRDHRIRMVDGDLLFRPGPRLPDGVEALGRALHPAQFADGGAP